MKKTILFAAMAVAALASCAKQETIGVNQGTAIDFRSSMATRATEVTTENLSEFNVTAFVGEEETNRFTDVTFQKSGAYFVSVPAQFWAEGTYNFFAYSPIALAEQVSINKTAQTLTGFNTDDNQVDFIVAKATGDKASNETTGVALTFNHELAQIVVRAKNTNPSFTFKVCGVEIGNVKSKANFNFADETWSSLSATYIFSSTYSEPIELGDEFANIMGEPTNAMLIPQQLVKGAKASSGNYIAVKIQIISNGETPEQIYPATEGEYAFAYVAIDTNLEKGNKYFYDLDFSNGAGVDDDDNPVLGKQIKFTVTVTDWNEVTPHNEIDMDPDAEAAVVPEP